MNPALTSQSGRSSSSRAARAASQAARPAWSPGRTTTASGTPELGGPVERRALAGRTTRATSSAGTSPAATASATAGEEAAGPGGEHDESGHAGQGRPVWDDAPVADQARDGRRRPLREPHSRLTLEMALLLLGARAHPRPRPAVAGRRASCSRVARPRAGRAGAGARCAATAGPTRTCQAMGPAGGVLLGWRRGRRRPHRAAGAPARRLAAGAEQDACRDRALTRTALERCDDALLDRLEQLGGLDG